MSNITTKKQSAFLKQLADNNLNLKIFTWNIPAGDVNAGLNKDFIFPYPIHVVGISICNEVAPTAVPIVITVSDGTSVLTITLTGPATEVQEAEDQRYEADTALQIALAAGAGNTSENICFQMHYIIDKPEKR